MLAIASFVRDLRKKLGTEAITWISNWPEKHRDISHPNGLDSSTSIVFRIHLQSAKCF